jgi:two-component system phosphate regulon sensor histidine kinase PhoR
MTAAATEQRNGSWVYLAAALAAILAGAAYGAWHVRQTLIRTAEDELEVRARLVSRLFQAGDLKDGSSRAEEVCRKLGTSTGTRFTVILATGQVIGDSDAEAAEAGDPSARPEVAAALKGKVGKARRGSGDTGRDMLFVAVPLETSGGIVAVVRCGMPADRLDGTLRQATANLAAAGLLAALITFMAGIRLMRKREPVSAGRPVKERKEAESIAPVRASGPPAPEGTCQGLDERFSALRGQMKELEAVLSAIGEAVIVLDAGECIVRINDAAVRLFGLESRPMKGSKIEEIIRDEGVIRFIRRVLESPEPVEQNMLIPDAGGHDLRAAGALLRSDEGEHLGAVIVLFDLTELKMLEQQRYDFVANISHELKTPVTTIKGFVDTLKQTGVEDRAGTEEFIHIISKHTDRLASLVENILSLAQIEQAEGLGELQLEKGKVRDVLEAVADMYGGRAEEKRIRIDVTCPETLTARFNTTILEQAVSNLVDNAVKYSEKESAVEIKAQRREQEVVIRVADQGVGIPAEHLSRIFERFYRVDASRSRSQGGSGLGLAIVKHIAQAHGGRIEVESEVGKGSVFSLYLPLE